MLAALKVVSMMTTTTTATMQGVPIVAPELMAATSSFCLRVRVVAELPQVQLQTCLLLPGAGGPRPLVGL